MAGVAEMLLQSHEEYIEPLPALPKEWNKGSYKGLVARGNFVFSAKWKKGKATAFTITSRAGGKCRVRYPGIGTKKIKDSTGQTIKTTGNLDNQVVFTTEKGETYTVKF
jgi:alpha-L-fucosidase 2